MNVLKTVSVLLIFWAVYSSNILPQEGLVKSYYSKDTLKSEINYSNNVKQGPAKYYYPNGKLQQELNYTDGKVEGVVKEYFDNGSVKEIYTIEDGKRNGSASLFDKDGKFLKDINFENGRLVKEEAVEEDTSAKQAAVQNEVNIITVPPAITEKRNTNNPDYLDSADVMPAPVGGIKNIISKLTYPARAKEKGIQGVVKVRAYVDEYGEVTQDEVIQGISYGCDESAKITIYYSKFTPGILNGKPVKVQVVIPVEFKLSAKQ
jgi:TonB family protein